MENWSKEELQGSNSSSVRSLHRILEMIIQSVLKTEKTQKELDVQTYGRKTPEAKKRKDVCVESF